MFEHGGALQFLPHGAHVLETNRHVPHDGRHSDHLARLTSQRYDRKLDRDASAVLSDARHGKDIAVALSALSGRHDLMIAEPVPGPLPLRNDKVQ